MKLEPYRDDNEEGSRREHVWSSKKKKLPIFGRVASKWEDASNFPFHSLLPLHAPITHALYTCNPPPPPHSFPSPPPSLPSVTSHDSQVQLFHLRSLHWNSQVSKVRPCSTSLLSAKASLKTQRLWMLRFPVIWSWMLQLCAVFSLDEGWGFSLAAPGVWRQRRIQDSSASPSWTSQLTSAPDHLFFSTNPDTSLTSFVIYLKKGRSLPISLLWLKMYAAFRSEPSENAEQSWHLHPSPPCHHSTSQLGSMQARQPCPDRTVCHDNWSLCRNNYALCSIHCKNSRNKDRKKKTITKKPSRRCCETSPL